LQQIGQEIGRGGFGTVFEALCTDTGDFVAVKRVALHNIDSDSLASIALEIDLLKKLNHVNIVQYIDSIQTENYLHIVLEYVGLCVIRLPALTWHPCSLELPLFVGLWSHPLLPCARSLATFRSR
jgi:serine/threonine protein kinase